jgi:hypothetical protein
MINDVTIPLLEGSGVIVSSKYLLTCAHVVEGVEYVTLENESKAKVVARVYEEDGLDIALLEFQKRSHEYAPIEFLALDANEKMCAYGFPNAQGDWVEGKLMGENEYGWYQLKLDGGEINPGFSGAGVWDEERQRLCGIVVAKSHDAHKAYMIPISSVLTHFKQIIDHLGEVSIVKQLFTNLAQPNPQMVITQNGTNRLRYINTIKDMAERYYEECYHIALPLSDMTQEEYYREIASEFELESFDHNSLKRDLIKLIGKSKREIFILITDFENDMHLDDFAKLMRAVLDKEGRKLRVITIGGEKLGALKTNRGINSYFNYFYRINV